MPDRVLFISASALAAISVVLIYSLSVYAVVHFDYAPYHFVMRQLVFVMTALFLMWGLAQLDPDVWAGRIGFTLFLGALFLMIAMPFMPPWLVSEVGGAKRWIRLGPLSLAPVEFFKVGFVYFLAWSFSRKMGHHGGMGLLSEFKRFAPYAALFLVTMVLIAVMQKDLGQVVVLSFTLVFMLMLSGSSMRFFFALISLAFLFFVIFILTARHRIDRILAWWASAQDSILALLPESVASHLRVPEHAEAYQMQHALNAIYNGGFFGVGIGEGQLKLGFLGEVHTDFVLAGLAEECGFVGVLVVTGLFVTMLWRIFKISNRSNSVKYTLFSAGIGLVLSLAFLINGFGVSGVTPIKGISVPFVSYGGSAMLASAIGVGMVLMISKKAQY